MVTGDRNYVFGDITRKALLGKKDYEFGDVTRSMLKRFGKKGSAKEQPRAAQSDDASSLSDEGTIKLDQQTLDALREWDERFLKPAGGEDDADEDPNRALVEIEIREWDERLRRQRRDGK